MAFYSVSSKGNFKREYQIHIYVFFRSYGPLFTMNAYFNTNKMVITSFGSKSSISVLFLMWGKTLASCPGSGCYRCCCCFCWCHTWSTSQGLNEQQRQTKTLMVSHRVWNYWCITRFAGAFIRQCLWWKTEIASLFSNWKDATFVFCTGAITSAIIRL